MNKTFVFAPTHRVFEDWIRVNNLRPYKRNYQHIPQPSRFRGMLVQGDEKVIVVNHPAWNDTLLHELKYLAKRGGFPITEVSF